MQKAVGSFFGEFWRAYNQPTIEARQKAAVESQLLLEQQRQIQQHLHEQAAIGTLAKLEQQRQQAEHVRENPVPEGHDTVEPQFGFPEQMRMYQAYNQAGLDPKSIAETEKARLAADAFEQAMGGIKDPYILANMANKLDVSPHRQVGQSIYNRFTGENTLTDIGQAQAQKAQSEADEQAWRLSTLKEHMPDDSLMIVNALNNKELGKPIEAEVEGADGKTHKAMITQTPTGAYRYSTVAGEDGKPLVIPAEATNKQSAEYRLAQELVKTKVAPNLTEAMKIASFSKTKNPEVAFGDIYDSYQKDDTGYNLRDAKERMEKTILDFVVKYPDMEIPKIEQRIKQLRLPEADEKALLAAAGEHNKIVKQQQTVSGQIREEQGKPDNKPDLLGLIQQRQQQNAGTQPPPMPQPAPLPAPAPIPESLPVPEPPPMDFNRFAETVMSHNSPAEINAALQKQGMNMTPEAAGVMAIDAINKGVPARDIQQLFALLGLDWKPPS